ncbi:MAG: hypothetical protein NC828_06235 [Candidatus Omnitrophica bacterium]|nr:hypothetical protein [Candidatus Omnitrophota bacterium]
MRETQNAKLKAKIHNPKLKTLHFNFTLFVLSLSLLIFNFPAYAVDIEPLRLEHKLEAGKTYSGSFRLSNTSPFAVDISISTGEYRYILSENSIPPAGGKKTFPSCQNWLQFEKTRFSLNAGEFADAKFLIKVPVDATEEHLCAVIFDEKKLLQEITPKAKTGSVQIQFTPRFSIPVYLSIKNTEKISVEIKDISAISSLKKGNVTIKITLINSGAIHIRPFGTLVIFNQSGAVVKNLPIGKTLPIFPGYQEIIPVNCSGLAAGKYLAVATIEVSKNKIIQKKTTFVLEANGDVK